MSARTLPSILLLLPLFFAVAEAQDERTIDPAKLPTSGALPGDFVPAGWRLHEQIEGDLNRDLRTDVVLRLIEDLPSSIDGVPNERNQALLILLRRPDGGLLRAGFSGTLLLCTTCYGMLGGENGDVDIDIEKGVLVVNQLRGSRDAVNQTHRFRYDARVGQFLLIGEDIERIDRLTGHSTSDSRNYLAGTQIIEERQVSEDGNDLVVISRKRHRIPRERKSLDDM